MKIIRLYAVVFFSLLNLVFFSQNETKQWYFGNYAGLDFNSNPPTVLTNNTMTANYSCASIADASGNLLFYTNGTTVWDKTHNVMANGTGLLGNSGNSSQGSLIVKQPGNTNLYYILTTSNCWTCTTGFNYTIVDISLAAGNGSVTVKNANLYTGYSSGRLTATRHCNGIDVWILMRDWIYFPTSSTSSSFSFTPNFHSYLLTSTGISTTAVISPAAAISHTAYNMSYYYYDFGCMKLSPNGKKLGLAIYNNYYSWTSNNLNTFEIYDFDNTTGVVSNSLALLTNTTTTPYYGAWGCEFSPDGTKFYGSTLYSSGASIYQWNLCAGSPSAVVASIYTVAPAGNYGSMQLATDGKIYNAEWNSTSLGVFGNPNGLGAACNYTASAQSIAPKSSYYSLPNFMSSNFISRPPPTPFTYTSNNSFGCHTATFNSVYIPGVTMVGCAGSGYSLTNVVWNFGDPGSGSNNLSTVQNPLHVFTTFGTYSVQLVLYYSCGGGTDTLKQVVVINHPCISVSSTSITCANLGSATVVATGGVGPFGYTWTPSAQTGSIASGLSPGTYSITVYDFGTNVSYTAFTVFTSLIPLTGSINTTNSITCNGVSTGTGAITAINGGSSLQYFLWTNGTSNFTTASTNSLSAGLWSVTATDALTSCSFSNVIFITQPPPFNLTLSSNTPTNCAGANIVLTGTNSGGTAFSSGPPYTYTWNAGPANDTQTVTQSTSGTFVYTLNSSDANNCLTSNTIAVDFIANPLLSVSNVSICPLAIGTLTVSGATNYTWSSPSTTALTTGSSFTDSPTATQQYTLVGESLGCSTQTTASIILHNLPNPISNNNSPRCNGDLLSLNGFGGVSYVWSGPNSFTSTSASNSINPVSLANAGVYNLTVTAATGCTASISKTVVVNPTPTLSAMGSTVCTTQTLNLSASSFTGSTYLWSGPPNFTSSLQNPFIINPLTTNTGTYTVKVTSALGCTNIALATASVALPPSLTAQLSSNTLCSQAFNGSPNTITLTAGGANTYTLVTVPDMFNANPGGPISPLTAIPPNTGIASATLSGSNGVCTVTTGLTFSILPNPSITVSSPTPVICAGETYTYTNNGASSYTWSSSTPGFTTYNNGGVAVSNPSINSVFSVFGGSLGCNSASKTSTITVNPLPVFSVSPGTPTICLNNKITLSINGNASSYTWSPYVGLSSNVGSTVNAFPTSLQTYTALGSLNSCTNTALITVSVLALPNPTAIAVKPELCLHELITLQGYGGETYRWDGPVNLMYAGQTVTFVARSGAFSGTYTLTVTDVNGCVASNQVGVKINPLPNADLSISKQNSCVPFTSKFSMYTQSAKDSNIVAYWQLENQTFYGKQFSYLFSSAKTYSIFGYYSDTLTTCKNSATYIVEAYPLPKADFIFEPEKPVEGLDEVQFINTSSGDELKKFNWYFINNQGYKSENKNTSYLFNELGEYPVAMVVQNTWGCADTMVKAIKVESDYNLYVPNAFTPNEDNLNDVFLPIVRGVKLYELFIFNRWGKLIFSTNQIQTGWDGYYNGEPAKNDIYTWKISLSTNSGEMKSLNGHVTLSR